MSFLTSNSSQSPSGQDISTVPVGRGTHLETVLDRLLQQAEDDERTLSYHTKCRSERGRKKTGSYYTPADVAEFFWRQFFSTLGIKSASDAEQFVVTRTLIEPSAGSGVLIFALLKHLIEFGVGPDALKLMDLRVIDINSAALKYIRNQVTTLNQILGTGTVVPRYEHTDFLRYRGNDIQRPIIYFGNPPFVTNSLGSRWKNMYADFLHRCLTGDNDTAAIHFIVPLSVAFSRDYKDLRDLLRDRRFTVYASHFDNIPDTLFKSGKPQSENTNKANSQRCTILSAHASKQHRLYSTQLHRWSVAERPGLLSRLPKFIETTDYALDHQFIRPVSPEISEYLQGVKNAYFLGDLSKKSGAYTLHIGSAARNFIPLRDGPGSGTNGFAFRSKTNFYKFLGLVTSDVFFDYWRSIGDGFHLTRTNITSFPVSGRLDTAVTAHIPRIRKLWRDRAAHQKMKLNSGSMVHSYDFSQVAISLGQFILAEKKKGKPELTVNSI